MDTKWKKSKKIISFVIFFLGVCLTLEGLTGLLRYNPHGIRISQIDKLLEDDYQQSDRFRSYISNRLECFLIMATGGQNLWDIWRYGSDVYYGEGYDYEGYIESIFNEIYEDGYSETAEWNISPDDLYNYLKDLYEFQNNYLEIIDSLSDMKSPKELESYRDNMESYRDSLESYLENLEYYSGYSNRSAKHLTEEQKKQLAQKYHESIKGDQNLLYTILYDGKVLYSNSDLLKTDGNLNTPDGYNFLLYFDGEKVRIVKDGSELDVYGDGYYRDDSLWEVPGYRNLQPAESLKKVKVYMAAAKAPVLYTEGYGSSTRQLESSLYWIQHNLNGRRILLINSIVCLASGAAFLLLSLFCRKSRRQAATDIAGIQAKIWVEFKVLLSGAILYLLYLFILIHVINGSEYDLWQEFFFQYDYNYTAAISSYGPLLLASIPSIFWIILFWGIYFLWNDLRHNKGFWKRSLVAGLCRKFSAKELNRPLAKKMARRSAAALAAALAYGILALATVILNSVSRPINYGMLLLFLLASAGFLAAEYLIGRKNAEAALDMETLSRRISEIRNGNYDSCSTDAQFAGHDLEKVIEQLEDIRHGMAKAVEEQMKSQQMKVELIANVSHDIKTPLTSIISYVEFLKQEKNLPEHVMDYVKILDEKSQRLKNMVQDVFTVSKAASGELPMCMEQLDFGKLLRQTLADMEEQIAGSSVTFRTQLPDSPVMIMADGQRMYRVFQNLFQNALQYSLSGSRVYVTLKTDKSLAVASVKNTSHVEPEKGKDFTERFARGDQSRTDGGSGLGLSIAQTFTEACGGNFSLDIDTDRFIVNISFQIQP